MGDERPEIRRMLSGILTGQKATAEPAPVSVAPQQAEDWTREPLPMPENKQAISLRVDRDVLDYFKSTGKGYQTRMNAVLRAWMEAQKDQ